MDHSILMSSICSTQVNPTAQCDPLACSNEEGYGIDIFHLASQRIDTLTWTNPQTTGKRPRRRRAHTTCVYNNCIYVFGGGDGVQALNDTYQLNLADMHWTELKTTGAIPISRGYHTSNLIKNHFIVYGGSDGHECFSDVHVLDLGVYTLPLVYG